MNPVNSKHSIGDADVLEVGDRLAEAPSRCLIDTAFARELHAQLGLARAISWVDIAHTMTLVEQGVIPRNSAQELIAALVSLEKAPSSFVPEAKFGDLYTNREAWLSKRTDAFCWLGVARARREALTTAFHLVLCDALLALGEALARAADAMAVGSLRYRGCLMPDYTYLQATQPTTFGHYLQGFAWPILRDLDRVRALYRRANQCPAGIGSSNGSVTMQNRRRLAGRLGFSEPIRHARDAMWQADLAIEASSVAVAAVVNLDRLAEDLMLFATAEFGFVRLADRHARASKIMPQKRNPFALAFVRATANRLIGVQGGVAAAARTPSGQMDTRLFAYEAVPDAVYSAAEAASLISECIDGLCLNEAAAAAALDDRSACASDLAERIMSAAGISYRDAHGIVGRLVGTLEERGRVLADATASDVRLAIDTAGFACTGITDELVSTALDPAACVAARSDVGGAATEEVSAMASALTEALAAHRDAFTASHTCRKTALSRLQAEAEAFARWR